MFHKAPPGSDSAWSKYVETNLPLERKAEMDLEEAEVNTKIETILTPEQWGPIPSDLRLMVVRGFAEKKDRIKETVDAAKHIYTWRKETNSDKLLDMELPKSSEYWDNWVEHVGGEDIYGHTIFLNRVQDINPSKLLSIPQKAFYQMRTQHMETVCYIKANVAKQRGHRICKHIFVFDLKGLSIFKHFTSAVRNMLAPIFKIAGDCYPDSLWSMWLINTPRTFRTIWKVISPLVDPQTRTKIHLVGGPSDYLKKMDDQGIPPESIPVLMGGKKETQTVFDYYQKALHSTNTGYLKQVDPFSPPTTPKSSRPSDLGLHRVKHTSPLEFDDSDSNPVTPRVHKMQMKQMSFNSKHSSSGAHSHAD